MSKEISAAEAVACIKSGSVLAVDGFVGSACPEELLIALEKRFLETGEPRGMTVWASTGSGDVRVAGTPTGNWRLSAASGSLDVRVPGEQGFTLDARSSSGSLNVDVPLASQGRTDRRRVQGAVRGGGPTLELSTASGSISVR